MCPAVGGMGIFFYLVETEGSRLQNLGWVPILCLVVFVIVYAIGFGPLPWIMNVELFPR